MRDRNRRASFVGLILFWLYVGVPLLWGVTSTLKKAMALFGG